MKYLAKLGLYLAVITLASCAKDNPAKFTVDMPESVAVQDSIDNGYDPLKTYVASNSSFTLGAGVSLPEYTEQGVMHRLVNSNFQEIAAGYGMKHGAVVGADGTLDLAGVKEFLTTAEEAGISVYGHTLAWHANQNADYLNGLIAPLTVETPPFPNSLDLSGLKDGTMSGWSSKQGAGISVVAGAGLTESSNAVKLVSGSNASEPADLQLTTPEIPVNAGNEYHVEFFIKSDGAGKGRVSFEGSEDNTPEMDWTGSGEAGETFATGIGWKKISFNISGFTGSSLKLNLDLGYASEVTYYVDVNNFYVFDTEAEPVSSNMIANGDFESGGGFGGWGMDGSGLTEAGMGVDNAGNPDSDGHAFYVTNNEADANFWSVQTLYDLPEAPENGATYNLNFWVRGTAEGTIRPELQSPDYSADGFGQVNVTTEWQQVELSTTATADDRQRFIISYGNFAGTVYMDNFKLNNAAGTSAEVIVVEKTPEEKKQIVGNALKNWMSEMLANTSYVRAWDVVNEPMSDGNPNELKSGIGKELNSDEFYWQDYMGKDYGVKAFKWAREYADEDDLLFINDYNLEYNLDKCRGLIDYVNYLENNGATVDGIGTQMHISINTDKESIAEMFRLLAETGKMIKVSELDIGLGGVYTDNATAELYKQQSAMYQYVVEKYFEMIPPKQRYGITVWSPLDSPEGSSWRAGEPIGLWTLGFNRKRAYAGFANGLMKAQGSGN